MILIEGHKYPVIVIKCLDKGIIVQHENSADTEFIHISKLSTRFVSNVRDVVNLGDRFVADCIASSKRDGGLELSLQNANLIPKKSKSLNKHVSKCDSNVGLNEPANPSGLDSMIAESQKVLKSKQFDYESRFKRKRRS